LIVDRMPPTEGQGCWTTFSVIPARLPRGDFL
jgi:hypothetical protein